jgi:hypothetical protein
MFPQVQSYNRIKADDSYGFYIKVKLKVKL